MPGARDLPPALAAALAPPALPDEDEPDDPPRRLRFRAIFISDLHLGTPGCQAEALLDFLRRTESDRLYLVGDIVDGWQLRRRWYWHQSHNDVVQKLLRKARKGCEVVYVPGNHDEAARPYAGLAFGGITIASEAVHVTARGERFLVVHGDVFDTVVRCARWLALVGDALYTFLLRLNRPLNALRARLDLPFWSLARFAKLRVKNAVNYIGAFEQALAREARERGFDGVVCGHIHHAEIRTIDGIVYANDGDWVESLTALVETLDGDLRVLHWRDVVAATGAAAGAPRPAASAAGLVATGD